MAEQPGKTLDFVRRKLEERRVLWTHHVNMRLRQRAISRRDVLEASETLELVEEYPADKYLPSYLLLAKAGSLRFHLLIAVDVPGDTIRSSRPTCRRQANGKAI